MTNRNKTEDFTFSLPVLNDPLSCASKPSPFTAAELEILADLRRIKRQARKIQEQLVATPADSAADLRKRLDDLRAQWREKSRAYENASRLRMIALGHGDPS
jgi:hypothetical protein